MYQQQYFVGFVNPTLGRQITTQTFKPNILIYTNVLILISEIDLPDKDSKCGLVSTFKILKGQMDR